MYRFWRFVLKLPIQAPFGEFLRHIVPIRRHPLSWPPKRTFLSPHMTSLTVVTPKRTFLRWKHVVWARISATIRPGRVTEKKERHYNKKSHKSVIFPLFAGNPHWTNSTQKLHDGWCTERNHVCQISNWNLYEDYDFTGVEFSIFLLIFACACDTRCRSKDNKHRVWSITSLYSCRGS